MNSMNTKKKLNEQTITNELSGASKFFEDRSPSRKKSTSSQEPNDRTGQPIGTTDRSDRSVQPAGASAQPTVATELTDGVSDQPARPTQRYAFEIYTDQKRRILAIQAKYQIRTDKRLPASRIIREALDAYLEQLEVQLNRNDGKSE